MSHSDATVELADGTTLWAEYDGTADYARPSLHCTREAMEEAWRKPDRRVCECDGEREPAEYWTTYGGGFGWITEVCRACMVITGPDTECAAEQAGRT